MDFTPKKDTSMPGNLPRKITSTPDGRGRAMTRPVARGVVLPVTDRFDLWYLCEKAAYAKLTPYRRAKDQQPMYQRTVSQLVRLDNKAFDYQFPYCGEVGFDMSVNPPAPIMSRREPYRPSTFPVSQYQQLRNRLLEKFPVLRIETDLLSKAELESLLSSLAPSDIPLIWIDGQKKLVGLVRIPDVVRLKTFHQPGRAQYSQKNLLSVIEMKFPGDIMSAAQQMAYQRIAGDPGRLRLLETRHCDSGDKEKWRQWIRVNVNEPVYRPVGQVMSLASRASAEKHKLLIGHIDAEHEAARRLLAYQAPSAGPQMSASPSRNMTQDNQKAAAGVGLILSAPFVAVGTAMVATAAAPLLASTEGTAVVAHAGGQSVRFQSLIGTAFRKLAGGLAGAGSAAPALADSPASKTVTAPTDDLIARIEAWNAYQRHQSTTVQNYILWEDLPEKLHD